MDMQHAHQPRRPSLGRTKGPARTDLAAALEAARRYVRDVKAPVPDPVSDLPLDLLAAMAPDEHPCTRELARSLGRPGTIRSMQSVNRAVTTLLVAAGACGVPAGTEAWNDPLRFPWHRFTEHDATVLSARLASAIRNVNSRADYISRTRAILRQCRRQNLIDAARLAECLDVLKTPKGELPPAGRSLSEREIKKLFCAAAANADPWVAARDCAILAVFCTTGMRACELSDLRLCDYDRANRQLQVLSKGRMVVRPAFLTPGAMEYLEVWLSWRGKRPGPLFVNRRGNAFETVTLNRELRRLEKAAGIAHFSSHDFRRTLATRLLRIVDIPTVMKVLGHKQPSTTFRYDRNPEIHIQRALAVIHLGATATKQRGGGRRG